MKRPFNKTLFWLIALLVFGLLGSCAKKTEKTNQKENKADDFYLLLGTYNPKDSIGIYVYKFDPENGEASYVSGVSGIDNPSFLTTNADHTRVYAVSETHDNLDGQAYAYTFDKTTGKLTYESKAGVKGDDPCYISIDPSGQSLFVSNYSSGNLSVLSLNQNGSIDKMTQNIKHEGHGTLAPFQEAPHVHSARFGNNDTDLYVTDLGLNKIFKYKYDSEKGALSTTADTINVTQSSGPRHLAFSSNGKFMYAIHELGGEITTFQLSEDAPVKIDELYNQPADFEGISEASDIHISPDDKFLYATNRADLNEIVTYKIDEKSGKLSFVERQSTRGKTPRVFAISPDGAYVLVGHQNSDKIAVFKRDPDTGKLSYLKDKSIPVPHTVDLKMF